MQINGIVFKFGDSVNTDLIISGRYKFSITDMNELSKHLFEDICPDFFSKVKKGDSLIVAGGNFGCGSSREQAPWVIKTAGINAVVAKSFARIFYRNAINIGLTLIEADTDKINDNDYLNIDLETGKILVKDKNISIDIKPLPLFMRKILAEGGAVEYLKKHGSFDL
ncbi:MAG: 3-isopropylmalate dehydratase small subunit [Candidatus Omnitrophota bacterium]